MNHDIIRWLMDGDVSIQYQTSRDLLGIDDQGLQARIPHEGWGKQFLDAMNPDQSWGRSFYQPKWTSTHYTLFDLKHLMLPPDTSPVREIIEELAQKVKAPDGGINPAKTTSYSDVCVSGMFLSYACWFRVSQERITSVADSIIDLRMGDGGFNCISGASHSSLHSTLSVLEGIHQYLHQGYRYRAQKLEAAAHQAVEFLLKHRLFKSDRTGEIINRSMLRFSHPPRWHYSVVRALDYLRCSNYPWDSRMNDALELVVQKRKPDGRWVLHAPPPGQVHLTMEQSGAPSRWVTLACLRILAHYGYR